MAATFLIVPQWQGSGSSRAMRLAEGASAISGDLPVSATIVVEVPSEAGTDEGSEVLRLSSLRQIRDAQLAALATVSGLAITIGGDCGVDLASIHHAGARHEGMAVVWIDAHADLNTPEESPSRAFHGMVLRTLLGDGPVALIPDSPISAARVILAGTRSLDDGELAYIESAGIPVIAPDALDADSITAALVASGATSVYLHVDLDVLDPAEFGSLGYPEPFGVSLTTLLTVIAAAKAALPLAGAAVTEFAPASADDAADDLGSILRIIGALAS
ncbi:arginase family protein [Glaciihabitans sp. INWT7]|uniref:arginase family protein n=1 Tax=Glaciihabitans sp. INWT7 TaxID=2596912 RepID=UPI0021028033|nr:arginase family protein [Glaciihabitans sp. INWT7]